MADCGHHLELCAECGGLSSTRLERIRAVSLRIDDGPLMTPSRFYIGPVGEPCPNRAVEEEARG